MSPSRALQRATESAPISGPWALLGLVAAISVPFDAVLSGMVSAGQGIEAICLYLGLTRAALDGSLIRLGLRRPHDRPLRRPGAKGWSAFDTIRLIAWRLAGVHPETIGLRLQRSVGGVRSKCRRLGLPAPPRQSLRRVDPATLGDPEPDHFSASWAGQTSPRTGSSSSSQCGTAAGPIVTRSATDTVDIVSLHGGEPIALPSVSGQARRKGSRKVAGQRELQLFQIVRNQDAPVAPVAPAPVSEVPGAIQVPDSVPAPRSAPIQAPVVPSREADVDLAGDLTWIGAVKRPMQHRAVVWAISMLYFGGLRWRKIAERIGKTDSSTRTFLTRTWLPRDHDRSKFGDVFDEGAARVTLDESGYEMAYDEVAKQHYWRHTRFRRSVNQCRMRRRAGDFDDGHRSEPIILVTRRDLDARVDARAHTQRVPFAQNRAKLRA